MTYASSDDAQLQESTLKRERLRLLLEQRTLPLQSASRSSVIAIREQGTDPPLFCVLGGGAGIPSYRRLADNLDGRRVYGLQIAGATAEDPVVRSIPKLAALHLEALRSYPYRGPYILCGHSMAANVALELAQLLLRNGEKVSLLVLIDQPGPDVKLSKRDWLYWQWAAISHLAWRQRWQYIANAVRFRFARNRRLPLIIRRLFCYRKHSGASFSGDNIAAAEYRRRMMDATLEALRTHHPRPYPGYVALIRAESSSPRIHCDAKGGWGSIAVGGIQVVDIHGHHMNIFEPPHVSLIAKKLNVLCTRTCEPSQKA